MINWRLLYRIMASRPRRGSRLVLALHSNNTGKNSVVGFLYPYIIDKKDE